MTNIENYDLFIERKKQKELKQKQIEKENQDLILANKNGYDTYRDYEYAMCKVFSRDPRFTLNKEYYNKCQKYLLDTLKAYIYYLRTGEVYNRNNANEGFVLTVYSLNELSNAIFENNKVVIRAVKKFNLDINDFVNQISEPRVDVRKLKIN